MHLAGVAVATFFASFVEFVEALTVILAVGAVRGWRNAIAGSVSAALVLAGLVAVFGPALAHADLRAFQLAVGTLVLLFALRWLRKAILRAAGRIPLHDEATAYSQARLRYAGAGAGVAGGSWDWGGAAAAFNVTMLEGAEVVFIVVALGSRGTGLAAATIGAGAALGLVVLTGALLHRPLTAIPENTMKTIVGVLLAAFGTFWTGEALGATWPGGDASLPLLAGFWGLLTTALMVFAGRRKRSAA